MIGGAHGWTIRANLGSDRPDYEADVRVCAHCGKTLFMCDGQTKKPLPADVAMERCGNCDKHVCRTCKWKLNSGAAICEPFVAAIDRAEEAYARSKSYG